MAETGAIEAMETTAGPTLAARSASGGGKGWVSVGARLGGAACAAMPASRNKAGSGRARNFMPPRVAAADDLRKRGDSDYL